MENLKDKLQTVAGIIPRVYEAGVEEGKAAGYDEAALAHWNAITANGTRTVWLDYSPFGYADYSAVEFPKPVVITGDVARLFRLYKGNKFPRKNDIDMTGVTNVSGTFSFIYGGELRVLPDYGIPALDAYSGTYQQSPVIEEIEVLRCHENTQFSRTFENCTWLHEIRIEGTIGQNGFDIHWSIELSRESIESIINALSDTTSGLTVTLSEAACKKAFNVPDDEDIFSGSGMFCDLVLSKSNWTIALI